MSVLKLAKEHQTRPVVCCNACEGIPSEYLTPGVVLKLSRYLGQVQAEVDFLRVVRALQAQKIRELRHELEGAPL